MIAHALALGPRSRLPVILQTEAAECGLACVAMVAHYHGRRIALAALRSRFAVSLRGSTLASLIDIAARLDLAARPVRLELRHLASLRLPCILHWRFDHFVVLKALTARGALIHDPATGERAVSAGELSAAFTGVALELWPSPAFARREERSRVRLRDLMGDVSGLRASLVQVLLLALALEVFAVVSPLFLQWVIDQALVSAQRDLLSTLALGFALLVLLQQGTSALRAWVIMHMAATLHVQWQANVFTHLLRLPLPYFEKRHPGDTISRFRSIDVIRRTLTTSFVEAVADGIMTAVTLVVILLYSPILSALCVGAVLLYALARWVSYQPLRRAAEEHIVHGAAQESHFLETVRGVRTIKLFDGQDQRRSHWLRLLVEQINAGLRGEKLHILCKLVNGLLFGMENVLVVWLGARLVLDGQLTVGMLMAFIAYKNQFSSRVAAVIDKLVELKMLRLQGERLADIVTSRPEPRPAPHPHGAARAPRISGVSLRGVYYRYAEHEPHVLAGIDLDIAPGECVVISGVSGSGKTTLLNVILGMLPPTQGRVLIGGEDVAGSAASARRAVAAVLQDDALFAGSIADNIGFFDAGAERRAIETCARLAAIHDEIVRLPMGYETFVGHMGSVLSGGQRQRILLARALYRRPSILILDEATSHLDVDGERVVTTAIRALSMTRIIVTHRRETAATADRLFVLHAGKLTEQPR